MHYMRYSLLRNNGAVLIYFRGTGEDLGEGVREDCQAPKLDKEDAMDRCKWMKVIKDVRWSGWV